jgi:hypothetical protein
MTTQRVRNVGSACEVLRSRYLPAAPIFCRHRRFVSPKTETDLNRYFKTVMTDVRASSLPQAAQDNLIRNVYEVP